MYKQLCLCKLCESVLMDVYFLISVWLQSTTKMGNLQSPQSVNLYFVLVIEKSVTSDAQCGYHQHVR